MQLVCRWVKLPVTESPCHALSVLALIVVAEQSHVTALSVVMTRV